jgi:hypothetical protein
MVAPFPRDPYFPDVELGDDYLGITRAFANTIPQISQGVREGLLKEIRRPGCLGQKIRSLGDE